MTVLLSEGEMAGIIREIVVTVLEGRELDHEAMREPALPMSVSLFEAWPSSANLSAFWTIIDSAR